LGIGIAIGCDDDNGRNDEFVRVIIDEDDRDGVPGAGDDDFFIPGVALRLRLRPTAVLRTTLAPNTGGEDPLADIDKDDIDMRSLLSSTLTNDPFPFIIIVIVRCGLSVSSELSGVPTPTPTPTGYPLIMEGDEEMEVEVEMDEEFFRFIPDMMPLPIDMLLPIPIPVVIAIPLGYGEAPPPRSAPA
jgi:hypothetical protein